MEQITEYDTNSMHVQPESSIEMSRVIWSLILVTFSSEESLDNAVLTPESTRWRCRAPEKTEITWVGQLKIGVHMDKHIFQMCSLGFYIPQWPSHSFIADIICKPPDLQFEFHEKYDKFCIQLAL